MTKIIFYLFLAISIVSPFLSAGAAEDSTGEIPPAAVTAAEIRSAYIAPESEFVGTVYYRAVSDVASETKGKVEKVNFEEGDSLSEGDLLVELSSDLLEKSIEAAKADYEQVLSDLEKARRDLVRSKNLFNEKLVTEQDYDEKIYAVSALEKRAVSLKAELERRETEQDQKKITAPFDGIVIEKRVERGEWISEGSTVATVASESVIDIIAEVPEHVIRHVRKGMKVPVRSGGKEITGKVVAIIQRGDIATRTFPVKIRTANTLRLIEGMEARVKLPAAEKRKMIIVPRDAITTVFGQKVIFRIDASRAVMVPVNVLGYEGFVAGIDGKGLSEGVQVVVKGNERLQNGQEVQIIKRQ